MFFGHPLHHSSRRKERMRQVIYDEAMDGITISRIIRNYEFNMPFKHTHDEYEIYYLIRGERSYFIENRLYHVQPGSLVFINRNVIHMTSQYGENYHERIVLELNEEPLSSLLASTGELSLPDFFRLHQGIIQVSPENQAYILSLFDGIADELATQDPGFRLMALEKLTRLLVFSLRYFQCSEPELLSDSPIHRRISEIAAYICDHYADAGSLEQVAQHFYMSKSYLNRVFKECTGYTVNEYINVNRIQQARKLLAETTLPVSDIASSLGYESVTYFEKVFRKHTETSPLKYRRQYLKDTQAPAVRPQSHIGEQ